MSKRGGIALTCIVAALLKCRLGPFAGEDYIKQCLADHAQLNPAKAIYSSKASIQKTIDLAAREAPSQQVSFTAWVLFDRHHQPDEILVESEQTKCVVHISFLR